MNIGTQIQCNEPDEEQTSHAIDTAGVFRLIITDKQGRIKIRRTQNLKLLVDCFEELR